MVHELGESGAVVGKSVLPLDESRNLPTVAGTRLASIRRVVEFWQGFVANRPADAARRTDGGRSTRPRARVAREQATTQQSRSDPCRAGLRRAPAGVKRPPATRPAETRAIRRDLRCCETLPRPGATAIARSDPAAPRSMCAAAWRAGSVPSWRLMSQALLAKEDRRHLEGRVHPVMSVAASTLTATGVVPCELVPSLARCQIVDVGISPARWVLAHHP